jgi:signal transduction histidine kinase
VACDDRAEASLVVPVPPPNDDLLAVIAHSLLGSVSVIVGGTELLSTRWSELGERRRNELLVSMQGQARHVAEVLDNLVRLGDPHLIEALDGLTHDGDARTSEAPVAREG